VKRKRRSDDESSKENKRVVKPKRAIKPKKDETKAKPLAVRKAQPKPKPLNP